MRGPGHLTIHRDYLDGAGDDHLGSRIPPHEVREVRLNRTPAEVVRTDGRVGFVEAAARPALVTFARLHRIPSVERTDVWALLCEPFLDTELEDAPALAALADAGFGAEEVAAIRDFLRPSMLALTALTWEWVHYGLYDVLSVRPPRLLPAPAHKARFLPPFASSLGLRLWAEGISHRAPVRQSFPEPPAPTEAERDQSLESAFPAPERFGAPEAWSRKWNQMLVLREEVLAAWREPHRRYHGPNHLHQVLTHLRGTEPTRALALAAFFHDAVYDPSRRDNEEKSAKWLEETLAAPERRELFSEETVKLAARIVRATARPFELPGTEDRNREAILRFMDADFAVFATTPDEYDTYRALIREEYGQFDDDAFRQGRTAFLRRLQAEVAARGRFFHFAQPIEESLAHENLARELADLDHK